MLKKLLLISILIFPLWSKILAKENIIAKIPEASGISFSNTTNTLFVVNDEGTIYEISTKGEILREKHLGNYDFEGIAVDDKNQVLLLAIEGDDEVLVLSKISFKKINQISINRKYKKIKVLKKGNDGIEGLTLHKNKLYISNQSNKKYPKEDSSVIVIIDYKIHKNKQKIKDIIDHGYKDIAGLCFYKKNLYMVSDKENLLIKYDIKKRKTIKEYKLNKKYAQEGITFDKKGNLYLADDKGHILKIKEFKD